MSYPGWGNWITDLDSIRYNGLYAFQEYTTNIPLNFSGVGLVLHLGQSNGAGAYLTQLCFGLNNYKFYVRVSSESGQQWTSWKEIQYVS